MQPEVGMTSEPPNPKSAWFKKELPKVLAEHALKIILGGLLVWLAAYVGGKFDVFRCAFVQWFTNDPLRWGC